MDHGVAVARGSRPGKLIDFATTIPTSTPRTGSAPAAPDGTLTQAGSSLGTPACVAYELLGGAHPFAGKTGPSPLIAAHLAELPAPLATRVPELACAKAALVMQCLTKIPSERPANA